MSLYSHGFQLLARPTRSVFSRGSEATRATLPDLATVDELRTFVRRVIVLQFTYKTYFTQVYLSIAILCLLITIIALVVLARMYEHSFWLVRIIKRPSGTLIVPNALLAFTVAEGLYGCLYIVFVVFQHLWFKSHARLPHGFVVWLCATWCPLFLGPAWAIWGTYHAATTLTAVPVAADVDVEAALKAKQRTCWRRWCASAAFSNTLFLFTPILFMLSIIIPAACGELHNQRAIEYQQQWLDKYAGQTVFTEAMVQDAQRVWFTFMRGCWVASALFALWCVYAILLGITYMIVSVRLILCVRREMTKSKTVTHKLQLTVDVTSTQKRRVAEVMRKVDLLMKRLPSPAGCDTEKGGDTSFYAADRSVYDLSGSAGRLNSSRTVLAADVPRASNIFAQARTLMPDLIVTENDLANERVATPSFSDRSEQVKQLRKAYRHILIQVAAISPGIFCFAILACCGALVAYSSTEQPYPGGGTYGQRTMPLILLGVNWVTIVVGCTCVFAIAQRTYEPILRRTAK